MCVYGGGGGGGMRGVQKLRLFIPTIGTVYPIGGYHDVTVIFQLSKFRCLRLLEADHCRG